MIIWLNGIPHVNWATYAFIGMRYGEKSFIVAECFNSWIKNNKGLPQSYLAERIRIRLMEFMYKSNKESQSWEGHLTPRMEGRLKKIKDVERSYRVKQAGDGLFEVYTLVPPKKKNLVELYDFNCTCRRWELSFTNVKSIPYSKKTVYHYVDPTFTSECYCNAYSHPIVPILDVEKPDEVDESSKVVPPSVVEGPGRPPKKRYIPRSEKTRKKRMCLHCWKLAFYNKRTCPDPPGEPPITTGRKGHGLGKYFGL
ncbi:uncharacterized protein LOC113291076 [Papaver somniferum]|uniref:uncharacterized protein LOC113291076 n=1 Tax=Papaver somniferum TaxID=3469 RepID=UPI000E6F6FDB|nr:uncharacterized protein LOC113291076 [Papaver somniferum]